MVTHSMNKLKEKCIVYFKSINYMVFELCFNKAVKKKLRTNF